MSSRRIETFRKAFYFYDGGKPVYSLQPKNVENWHLYFVGFRGPLTEETTYTTFGGRFSNIIGFVEAQGDRAAKAYAREGRFVIAPEWVRRGVTYVIDFLDNPYGVRLIDGGKDIL